LVHIQRSRNFILAEERSTTQAFRCLKLPICTRLTGQNQPTLSAELEEINRLISAHPSQPGVEGARVRAGRLAALRKNALM
jgi:hypothetical protein